MPIPAGPMTLTRRGRRSRLVAAYRSLSARSSSSRPTKGASRASLRLRPPRPATTRRARQAGTGLALPRRTWSPAGSKAIAREAARQVASPTSTVPAAATDWSRDAVLTRSPATIPWLVAPDRDRGLAGEDPRPRLDGGPNALTASSSSRAARTARSASSSRATGAPQTAITASPMNFSTVPPYRPITSPARSKYRVRVSRTSSASRSAAYGVKPTRSANRTLTQAALGDGLGGGDRSRPQGARHQRRRARGAEPGARRVGGGARGAGGDERGGALGAEPCAGPVVCAAARAGRDGDGLRDAVHSSGSAGPRIRGALPAHQRPTAPAPPGERLPGRGRRRQRTRQALAAPATSGRRPLDSSRVATNLSPLADSDPTRGPAPAAGDRAEPPAGSTRSMCPEEARRMRSSSDTRWSRVLTIGVVATLALGACGGSTATSAPTATTGPATSGQPGSAPATAATEAPTAGGTIYILSCRAVEPGRPAARLHRRGHGLLLGHDLPLADGLQVLGGPGRGHLAHA